VGKKMATVTPVPEYSILKPQHNGQVYFSKTPCNFSRKDSEKSTWPFTQFLDQLLFLKEELWWLPIPRAESAMTNNPLAPHGMGRDDFTKMGVIASKRVKTSWNSKNNR
jgi:hypothetical protein